MTKANATGTSRIIEAVDYSTIEQGVLYRLAKEQHAARKEARANGEPDPATPAIEELTRRQTEMTSTRKAKNATGTRTKGRTDIRYFHDGRSMSEGHKSKLSTVAYFHSFDLDGTKPRLGTADFVAALKKAGVTDPSAPGWMVKLPNGVTIECRKDGDASQFKGEPVTRRAKATATKKARTDRVKEAAKPTGTTAKKAVASPAKKPTAKTGKAARAAAVKAANPTKPRQVTPIPKGQPVKKAAPKKAVAAKATRRTARKSA